MSRGGEIAGDGVRRCGAGATRRLELPILSAVPEAVHLFGTRDTDPAAALREAAGREIPIQSLRQIHGATVRIVSGEPPDGGPPQEGDALASRARGVAVAVFAADCVPILLADPRGGAVAAVHAGWRGTVRGVLREAIRTLRDSLDVRPSDLRVGLGPGIGPCCFEVGDEVVDALLRADPGAGDCVIPGARARIDLAAVNVRQALAEGVDPGRIQTAGLCTRCTPELASYRRDRDRAGRNAATIAWRA